LSALDLRPLLELLHERGVRFVIRRGGNVTADTDFGGLDVVQRARGVPSYSQLDGDAVDTELLGIPVRICSLTSLRQMKEAQGRAQDKADLENLPEV
jgi:hypothetical protein